MLLDAASLGILREEKKAKKHINDIQFSPNGENIIAAAGDGRLFILDLSLTTVKAIDIAAKRPAVRVDYSVDMKSIRINFQPDRLVFYNLENGEVESNPAVVKDVVWATHSCPYSWNTQGTYFFCWSLMLFG